MSVFGMFLAMTQMDFVLIRMFADLTVNTYTNMKFMRFKEYSSDKYHDIEMQCMTQRGAAGAEQGLPSNFSIEDDAHP